MTLSFTTAAIPSARSCARSRRDRQKKRPCPKNEFDSYEWRDVKKTPDYGAFFQGEAAHEIISLSIEIGSVAVKRGNLPLTMM